MTSRTPGIPYCLIVALLVIGGCAATDDPRQGGLFSFDPAAYEKRIAERQARLDVLNADTARQEQEAKSLEETLTRKRAEQEELARKLASLDVDMARTEAKIRQAKVRVKDREQRRTQLMAQLQTLKQQRSAIEASSSAEGGEAAQKVEIERLQREIDRLLKEAEALSKL